MSTNRPAQGAAAVAGGEVGAPDARQLRTILIAVSFTLMAVIASVSGLNVAQTHMAVEFGASHDTVLWIINSYTLALAALLLPLGAIGDRLGRKPMLIAGLGIFGVANVVAGHPCRHHLHLPRGAARQGDRRVDRRRRRRRHPWHVPLRPPGRCRGLALAVRAAGGPGHRGPGHVADVGAQLP